MAERDYPILYLVGSIVAIVLGYVLAVAVLPSSIVADTIVDEVQSNAWDWESGAEFSTLSGLQVEPPWKNEADGYAILVEIWSDYNCRYCTQLAITLNDFIDHDTAYFVIIDITGNVDATRNWVKENEIQTLVLTGPKQLPPYAVGTPHSTFKKWDGVSWKIMHHQVGAMTSAQLEMLIARFADLV